MSWQSIVQSLGLVALLGVTVPPLGRYLAAVFGGDKAPGDRVFKPIERFLYRASGIDERREQEWRTYAMSLLAFSLASVGALYLILRIQGGLPLNGSDRAGMHPAGAFNTAVSFVTNTNWQGYAGGVTVSNLTQMIGLTVQNVV
ncbi:MAG TPA: potassium-transporting ATPase subunit KdpA, partial [Ilumatobacteraceae bacterium]|nr:potassium-transporting ATPase subunit KdpA [Ilumatobacteraceae bacterium]